MPKISTYPSAGSVVGTDVLLGNVGGVTKQVPVSILPTGGGGGGGWAFISAVNITSSTAQADLVLDTATYDDFQVIIDNLQPVTADASLQLLGSTNGGSSFLTTSIYTYCTSSFHSSSGVNTVQSNADSAFWLHSSTSGWGLSTSNPSNLRVDLYRFSGSQGGKMVVSDSLMWFTDPRSGQCNSRGCILTSSAVNAVRLKFDTGNIATGNFRLFGRVGH